MSKLKEQPIALLDGDQFTFGYTLHDKFPEVRDYQFAAVRNIIDAFPGKIIPITNRPLDIASKFAELVGSGLACAESGATFFVCGHTLINSRYDDYRRQVRPDVIKIVNERLRALGLQDQIAELNGNLVTACFYPTKSKTPMEKFNESVTVALDKHGLGSKLAVSANTRLDISPRDLNKEQALLALANGIFELVYRRGIPWANLIIGDDSQNAIPILQRAQELSAGKAKFITVANADDELKTFVIQNGGYLSPKSFAEGVKDGLQHILTGMGIHKQRGVWTVSK